ncbi:MAG: DUF2188 domain-containing protein [Spirosomataceae bacterium]
MKKNGKIHVVKSDTQWVVKKEGISRPESSHALKSEALVKARIFKNKGFDVVVHYADGQISRWERSSVRKKIVAKPTEIYHKKKVNQKIKGVTIEELRKLKPVLNRLAEYDKKGSKLVKKK